MLNDDTLFKYICICNIVLPNNNENNRSVVFLLSVFAQINNWVQT